MSVYSFEVNKESIKRMFSVYVVVAYRGKHFYLYVGKTGDNREGCNPVISRCGNHFSYNKIHSQIRNKISELDPNDTHESYNYKYFFIHFDAYNESGINQISIDRINEMERWLNQKVQNLLIFSHAKSTKIVLLNPYKGNTKKRTSREPSNIYRTVKAGKRLDELVFEVQKYISSK